MASVVPTAQGTWRCQVSVKGTRDGKTFDTKEAAELWGKTKENEIRRKAQIPELTDKRAAAQSLLSTAVPRRVLSALSEVPYSGLDLVEASLPIQNLAGLYFLVKDKEVVYVGQTIDIFGRISKHRRLGKDFDSFSFITCDDQEKRDELESTYILALAPWMNLSAGRRPIRLPIWGGV
jgi:hypothetical protein